MRCPTSVKKRVPSIEIWDTLMFRGQRYTVKQQRELRRSNQRDKQKIGV